MTTIEKIRAEINKELDALNKVRHLAGQQTEVSWNNGFATACDHILSFLDTLQEQKPVEWSEEDEKMLDKAIELTTESGWDRDKEKCLSWLKSLRPSWKPSEVCYGAKGDPDPAGVWKASEEQMEEPTAPTKAPAEIYVTMPKKETGDYVGAAWRTQEEGCEHIKYIRADLVEKHIGK